MSNDIFISYTQPDKDVAFTIHDLLQSNGLRSWIDTSANYGVISGNYFGDQIVRAIKECKLFVLVYSNYSNVSTEIIKEISNAGNKEKHVFKLDNSNYSDKLAYFLTGLHYIDATGENLKAAYLILLNNLKLALTNFGQRTQLSTDKILLNNGLKFLKQKQYENAEAILAQYDSIAYNDIDAKFYLAISIGRGKKPRKLDGLIVRRIESLLNPYIGQSGYGHINVLLAFIRFGYYTMNGYIEPQPDTSKLLQNVRSDIEKLNEILFHFDDPDNEVWRLINSSKRNH
jgi:TIR domain